MDAGFVRIGRVEEFGGRRGRAVRVGESVVAVFRVDGRIRAIQDRCPHMGASLADGRIEDGQVICHWHHWKFDLETGRSRERTWACAAVWEVRIEAGEVFVKPPPEPAPPAAEPDDDWEPWDPERFFRS